jgi:hypothetical protein
MNAYFTWLVCEHRSEDCIAEVCNGIEQLQLDQWLDRCRGVDNSKWTNDLDKSKVALDVRPQWKCGQVNYTKNCVVHG